MRTCFVALFCFFMVVTAKGQGDPAPPVKAPALTAAQVEQDRAAGVLSIVGDVKPPILKHQSDPHFSKEARKKKVSGVVELSLYVDEHGLPQDVHVVRSVGYGLDEAAVKAVQKYRFHPAMLHDAPVKVRLYVDVNFQFLS